MRLSHARVCDLIATQTDDDFALIIEDDVILGDGLRSVLQSLAYQLRGDEVVLLYTIVFGPVDLTNATPLIGRYEVADPAPTLNTWGTQAYANSRSQAAKLLDAMLRVECRADDWWGHVERGIVGGVRVVFPFPVLHAELNSDVGKVFRNTGRLDRASISRMIHAMRLFPFYQLSLAIRRFRAERRQRSFLTREGKATDRTFLL